MAAVDDSQHSGPANERGSSGNDPGPDEPTWQEYQPPQSRQIGFLRRLRRYSFSIVVILSIVGVGALLYFAPQRGFRGAAYKGQAQDTSGQTEKQEEDSPESRRATLTVYSAPTDAWVIIEGDTVGRTPLPDHRLQSGVYMVAVAKENYSTQDTALALRGGDLAVYRPQMSRADRAGRETQELVERTSRTPSGGQQEPAQQEPAQQAPSRQQEAIQQQEAATDVTPGVRQDQAPNADPSREETPESSATARPTGTLQFRTDPGGTAVELNEEAVGQTPLRLDSVPAGTHEVTFARSGYETLTRQVEVQAGEEVAVEVSLDARPGHIRILVEPWGSISINQQRRVQRTDVWYEAELPAGTHDVSARHPSLGRRSRTVEVPPGDTLSVVFDMQEE